MELFGGKEYLLEAAASINRIGNGAVIFNLMEDGSLTCVFVNEYMANLLGYTEEEAYEIMKKSVLDVVNPLDRGAVFDSVINAPEGKHSALTARVMTKDGRNIWVLGHYQKFATPEQPCVIVTITDVDELVGAMDRLKHDSSQWEDIVNSIPVGISIFNINDGKTNTIAINDILVDFANILGEQLDGQSRHWSKTEMALLFNQNLYVFCIKEDIPVVDKMLLECETKKYATCTFRLRGSTEENTIYLYASCFSKPNPDGGRNYYVTYQNVSKEIAQSKELQSKSAQLMKLSYEDHLTKVRNRNALFECVDKCASLKPCNVGIGFVDVNGLRQVNEMLGHSFGDDMIIRTSKIIESEFDKTEIFRISGDEFVLVKADIEKGDFQMKMRHLIENFVDEDNLASVGYVWKEYVTELKSAVNDAEQIMRVEKQKYYESEAASDSKHRPRMLNTLLNDLKNSRFVMFLQPKVEIGGTKIVGAEALVRKLDERGRIVPPYEFIPILEKEKLVPKIDFYILEKACKFLEKLKKQGKKDFKISVNMSRVTLAENDYIDIVSDIISRFDIDRSMLEFEVTESNKTMDSIRLEDYIKQIKELGISISLDDVGTDYSSLPMLLLEGVDTVKLDRSLIIKLGNEKAKKMLGHVIRMSHDLGLSVIAEGVETDEARAELAAMECDEYQGYLMSKPVSEEEFAEKFI